VSRCAYSCWCWWVGSAVSHCMPAPCCAKARELNAP
jgi:hypothetical protein